MYGFSIARRGRRRSVFVALTTAATLAAVAVGAPVSAVSVQHAALVGQDPVNWTPHALDGTAFKILAIGGRIYVGGSFTQIRPSNSATVTTQRRLFAFNATTGAIDTTFKPVVDGTVRALVAAPDGQSLYIGGDFTNVNGVRSRGVERISATTGASVSGFTVPEINGGVDELMLAGNRLLLGGRFQTVGGASRRGLAALNAGTGAADASVNMGLDGARVTGSGATSAVKVTGMDVTPDGSKLVIMGNFSSVAGQARHQIAVVNLTTSPATLSPWTTTRYQQQCANSFPTYMRGVDISADGTWFVAVTTGLGAPARFATPPPGGTWSARSPTNSRCGSTTPAGTRCCPSRSPGRPSTSAATSAGWTTRTARTAPARARSRPRASARSIR
ncbi:hypothetical protein ACFQZ4_23170 [Catellatospora coxensis]